MASAQPIGPASSQHRSMPAQGPMVGGTGVAMICYGSGEVPPTCQLWSDRNSWIGRGRQWHGAAPDRAL